VLARIEQWLEGEREQIALWVPVAIGLGVAAWFVLPARADWLAFCCVMLGLAAAGLTLPAGGRLRAMVVAGGMLACAGCLLVWGKAVLVGDPPLARPAFVEVIGRVTGVQRLAAQKIVRIRVQPENPGLPRGIRVNLAEGDVPDGMGTGARIRFRSRLMPPAPAAIPGGFDFAPRAYFAGIGATGRALLPVTVIEPARGGQPLRARAFSHVMAQLDEGPAGIAAALLTGDQSGIPEADAEAMRRSGLAHLLSISGLHVTALIGAVIFLLMRLMALSRRAALDWPLMLIAAAGGAAAGIGYTIFSGAEVPTVRSCIAALLVLGGLALGRDAMTLRLVASGAIIVLAFWPEALMGPSFQMSFAAVVALVALSEHRGFRALVMARDEIWWRKTGRALLAMLATGIAVELTLMPIALHHFHQAGMLGALANLVAIPLTTFVVMPFEALALLFDIFGLGAPFWWLTGRTLDLLLLIAHGVSSSPLAAIQVAARPPWTLAFIVAGLLWVLLWRDRLRWIGLVGVGAGMVAIVASPVADILVTGDGKHVALRMPDGRLAILRDRAGDYVRDMLAENAGHGGTLDTLSMLPQARCSTELCAVRMASGGRRWNILATRSSMLVDRPSFEQDCARSDIVISDRRLPYWCRPRWMKIDRTTLAHSGGIAIYLDNGSVRTARAANDQHPWITPVEPRRPRRWKPRSDVAPPAGSLAAPAAP